jgi:hypothetical protein
MCSAYFVFYFNQHYSLLDVKASDLPAKVKARMKLLSHELAGSLVFDYG